MLLKTPVVLLIYTFQSGKSLGSDRGKKKYTIWVFRNGQADRYDDRIILL